MSYFDEVKQILTAYQLAGEKILEDGTWLIGKAPHVAPGAWLHKLFPPLTEKELQVLELEIGSSIPDTYKQFLRMYSNGLKVFIDDFSLNGLRKRAERSEANVWQPYSLVTINKERPNNANARQFFIGSYAWDGSLIYIESDTHTVHRCTRESIESLNRWIDFKTFLTSELNRMRKLFDSSGRPFDTDKPTSPKPYIEDANKELEETTVICSHVLSGERPVLYACKPDGQWGFTCGNDDHDSDSYLMVKIRSLLQMDATLQEVLDLPDEWEAEREAIGASWRLTEAEEPEEE